MNITKYIPDGAVGNTPEINRVLSTILPEYGTPAAGVAASATLTVAQVPTAGDTISIAGRKYTFLAAGSTPAETRIVIGTTLHLSQLAIIAAIAGTDGVNDAHEGVTISDFELATLTTSLTGANNDLTFTAKLQGSSGNDITVALVDPSSNDNPLSIDVTGTDIVITLATGEAGAITSTSADIIAAIAGDSTASALVLVTNAGSDTGAGVVTELTETALADGADVATITASVTGAHGNSFATVAVFDSGSNLFSAGALSGGVTATSEEYLAGKQLFDGTNVYIKTAEGSGLTGWRKVAHAALS